MSPALIVATIVVAGWNLTLTVTAFLTGVGPFHSKNAPSRPMQRTWKQIRADVGKPTLDARTNAWKRESGNKAVEYIESRVRETSKEVTTAAPYAEASVTVSGEGGREARRCSICMN